MHYPRQWCVSGSNTIRCSLQVGTVIAQSNIMLSSGANLHGAALSANGAITIISSDVTLARSGINAMATASAAPVISAVPQASESNSSAGNPSMTPVGAYSAGRTGIHISFESIVLWLCVLCMCGCRLLSSRLLVLSSLLPPGVLLPSVLSQQPLQSCFFNLYCWCHWHKQPERSQLGIT